MISPSHLSGEDVSVVELLLGVRASQELRPLEGNVLDALPVRLGREVGGQLLELWLRPQADAGPVQIRGLDCRMHGTLTGLYFTQPNIGFVSISY